MNLLSFDDAITEAGDKPKLMLGNGFSIAWDPSAFAYESLREKADFSGLSCDPEPLFKALATSDFEVVIDRLRAAEVIAQLYGDHDELSQRARSDAAVIREALATALAAGHPDHTGCVTDESYTSVRRFLAHFDAAYTLNYDMLLYWATMTLDDGLEVPSGDGFANDPDEPDAPWVTWNMARSWTPKVFYLHGALHLFDAGDRLKKLTWVRTDVPLLDQIREQLEEQSYPLVVTEGSSSDKKTKILHSAYLSKALRSFCEANGALFIYGHSLAPSDEHIIQAIVRGKFDRLFVGVYGDPASEANRALIERAELMAAERVEYVADSDAKRRKATTLNVEFYDAATARVWNG